jgi:hypothetical protein
LTNVEIEIFCLYCRKKVDSAISYLLKLSKTGLLSQFLLLLKYEYVTFHTISQSIAMEDKMKYFIPMIILSFVLLSCAKKDDEAATTDTLTCTGTSSGSGPTIGSVALEEASYLSTCFGGSKVKLEFKNNSSAQYTSYAYGDSSCSGTPSESSFCLESITVSSTTVTKPVYYVDNSSLGDNVTGYATTGTGKHNSSTLYMSIYAESTSVFWLEQASEQATLDSNTAYTYKFTKQ